MIAFVLVTFLTSVQAVNVPSAKVLEEGELVFAHVVYRHGDRTPIDPYPNDPYRDPKFWPTDFGQLTNEGKRHHYELGQWLRQRYNGLINETYSRKQIVVRSTDVDRTLMSAYSNLAGLYPPKGKDAWMGDMNWQPIPVHTEHEKHDKILAMKKPCPVYSAALKEYKQSEDYKKFNLKYRATYDYVSTHSGRVINDLEGAGYIYSCLHIEQLNNMTLPDWTMSVYPEPLRTMAARGFATSTFTRQMARLKAGPLLKEILERFKHKVSGKVKERTMVIYSGHDTTVSALLNTLRVFEYHNPPFRACIMLELRMLKNQPFVTVVYKNDTQPITFEIPNCGIACPLDKMFSLYDDVLPKDWDTECELPSSPSALYTEVDDYFKTSLIVCAVVAVICLIASVIYVVRGLLTRNRRSYYTEVTPDKTWNRT